MTPGVAQGYWWATNARTGYLQILRVTGVESDETAQIVEWMGGGFVSLRRARELGFEFRQKVPDFQEAGT